MPAPFLVIKSNGGVYYSHEGPDFEEATRWKTPQSLCAFLLQNPNPFGLVFWETYVVIPRGDKFEEIPFGEFPITCKP